jgi:hypothetical protein
MQVFRRRVHELQIFGDEHPRHADCRNRDAGGQESNRMPDQ